MPTDAGSPRAKRQAGVAILAIVILMIVVGGVAVYLLGREDPRDPASASLAWGDRLEKRTDAFIDGIRPEWTDRVEERLEKFVGSSEDASPKSDGKQTEKEPAEAEPPVKAPAADPGNNRRP